MKVKAYLITFNYYESQLNRSVLRNVVIVAMTKKEAGDMFIRWLTATDRLENTSGVVCQQLRKNKRNAKIINEEYYIKENRFLQDLEAKKGIFHGIYDTTSEA